MGKNETEVKLPKWAYKKKSKFEKDVDTFLRKAKVEWRRAVKWLFFYQPKDNTDKMLHIFDVIAALYILYRAVGGW